MAFQEGQSGGGSMTGPVSVASSQFATVAVVLSVLFNRERILLCFNGPVTAALIEEIGVFLGRVTADMQQRKHQ